MEPDALERMKDREILKEKIKRLEEELAKKDTLTQGLLEANRGLTKALEGLTYSKEPEPSENK
jgi:hypothetical protein